MVTAERRVAAISPKAAAGGDQAGQDANQPGKSGCIRLLPAWAGESSLLDQERERRGAAAFCKAIELDRLACAYGMARMVPRVGARRTGCGRAGACRESAEAIRLARKAVHLGGRRPGSALYGRMCCSPSWPTSSTTRCGLSWTRGLARSVANFGASVDAERLV